MLELAVRRGGERGQDRREDLELAVVELEPHLELRRRRSQFPPMLLARVRGLVAQQDGRP